MVWLTGLEQGTSIGWTGNERCSLWPWLVVACFYLVISQCSSTLLPAWTFIKTNLRSILLNVWRKNICLKKYPVSEWVSQETHPSLCVCFLVHPRWLPWTTLREYVLNFHISYITFSVQIRKFWLQTMPPCPKWREEELQMFSTPPAIKTATVNTKMASQQVCR